MVPRASRVLSLFFLFSLLFPFAGSAAVIQVEWTPSSAPDVHHYVLYHRVQGGEYELLTISDPQASSHTFSGLVVGTTYEFALRAFDTSGNASSLSNIASAEALPWDEEAAPPVVPPAVSMEQPAFEFSWNVSGIGGATKAGLEVSRVNQSFANPNGTEWDPEHCCHASILDASSGTAQCNALDFEGPGLYRVRVVALDDNETIICCFSDSAAIEVLGGAPPVVDAETSTVTASPEEIPADGESLSTITVSPRDADALLVGPGLSVTLQATAGTLVGSVHDNGNGTYSQNLRSSLMVTEALVSAVADGVAIIQQATVSFSELPPVVDGETSTVTASPEEIPADGESLSTITVSPRDADALLVGPGLSVTLQATAGTLVGSVHDNGDGTYSQQLRSSLEAAEARVSAVADGVAITEQASVTFTGTGIPAMILTGPGPGPENDARVCLFDPLQGPADPVLDFCAYPFPGFGVNVTTGDVDGDGRLDIITGAGPGETHMAGIRGFDDQGYPLVGIDFIAYETGPYGVNVACGDIDGDGIDEIISGPGPGPLNAPRVRGWRYDGAGIEASAIDFQAYGVSKWGVNVSCGDIDGDGFDEIITGAGPGSEYGPHVRGWNCDGDGSATAIGEVSYLAYGTNRWGVNVACGDIDGDGIDEIITGAGPGAVFGSHVRAWNFGADGEVTPLAGASFFAYATHHWGVNVTCGDIDGDAVDEMVTGPGPGQIFGAHVRAFDYHGGQVSHAPAVDFMAYPCEDYAYGVRVAVERGAASR